MLPSGRGSDDNTELSERLATRALTWLNAYQFGGRQASRMAATPWPPAAQIEISPRMELTGDQVLGPVVDHKDPGLP